MEVLKLLAEAATAGLTVIVDGDRLIIRGPKSAEQVVRQLGERKAEIVAFLQRPAPCRCCGCCIGWQTFTGRIACWDCEPPPATTAKLIFVDTPLPHWADLDDQIGLSAPSTNNRFAATPDKNAKPVDVDSVDDLNVDPWEAAIDWNDATPYCAECGSYAGWADGLGLWHCQRCQPPRRTERLLRDRERILAKAWRQLRRKHE